MTYPKSTHLLRLSLHLKKAIFWPDLCLWEDSLGKGLTQNLEEFQDSSYLEQSLGYIVYKGTSPLVGKLFTLYREGGMAEVGPEEDSAESKVQSRSPTYLGNMGE